VSSQELAPIENHIEVTSQHRLFLFTDGIIEAENAKGEPFGFDGIKRCLAPMGTSSFDLVLDSLKSHQGKQSQQDDITLVRLICDFDPENWSTHEPQHNRVEMEPSNWKLSSTMDYNTLKRLNPVPAMVNSLMEIQGLMPFRESIFLVATELFANSLDHGLLALDSALKKSPDGFAQFFELRQQRLEQLSKGNIKLFFSHVPHKTGGELTIQVHDTGCGFDEGQVLTNMKSNNGFSGRGIQLIRQICTSLEYSNDGRRATAIFTWSNK